MPFARVEDLSLPELPGTLAHAAVGHVGAVGLVGLEVGNGAAEVECRLRTREVPRQFRRKPGRDLLSRFSAFLDSGNNIALSHQVGNKLVRSKGHRIGVALCFQNVESMLARLIGGQGTPVPWRGR